MVVGKHSLPNMLGYALCQAASEENFVKFITEIESMLGLKDEEKLKFSRSATHKNIIVFEVGPFWGGNQLRREFLTLFIRAGFYNYKGDLLSTLLQYPLTKDILPVVDWFLSGNTVQKEGVYIHRGTPYNGIVRLFGSKIFQPKEGVYAEVDFSQLLCKPAQG